ncbi:MAG: YbhN family protein [Actinomycetota bacterium]
MRNLRDTEVLEEIRSAPGGANHIKRVLWSGVLFALGAVAIYVMQDRLREVLQSGERLRTIRPEWFVVMIATEAVSFACLWWLTRIVLPRVSWFVAATSQLVSNSVSRIIPGGAATGGAVYYRMLSVSGVQPTEAGGALAATSILTTAALVAIPAVAGVMALLGAPIPESMLPIAVAAGVMFVILAGVGAVGMAFDRPLGWVERALDRLFRLVGRPFRRTWGVRGGLLREERDRLVEVLGARWPAAIAASAGKVAFDYFALVASLYAVGADPRLSLVLLAFAGAQVLGMIPITPGGFGFVEVGLYSMLVISGISAQDASLAAVAYRLVSMWLPVISGFVAYLAFRARGYRYRTALDPA